ncbi:hypothetical protein [Streptomyces ehimensis]|uniref:Uncharacterized protein n=1 Tax=Streptomyces ehimensis TaxID=68195 RepID=A0ABV9BUV1_9ACTN
MRPGSLNERLQHLAEQAGVPYIDGKKVTSHSWRAGANGDMIDAGVPLAERNGAGRWGDHTPPTPSTTAATVPAPATRWGRCRCTAGRPQLRVHRVRHLPVPKPGCRWLPLMFRY